MKKITLLNTSVLTSYGCYDFRPISLTEAKELVAGSKIVSAIGHLATAEILSELLETEIPVNRTEFLQETGDEAIVFKLRARVSEGRVLNRQEIEEIGYDFGILRRLK